MFDVLYHFLFSWLISFLFISRFIFFRADSIWSIYKENYPFSEDLFEVIILNTLFSGYLSRNIYQEIFIKKYLSRIIKNYLSRNSYLF
jgi:hypothetical protein